MPERFSEEDARRIFARAAERQQAAEPAAEGLSLAELQEVGRAAGLDPAHVAAAVAEVRGAPAPAPPATFLGVDVEPRASRVIPGGVTDEVWEQMVARLRQTFKSKGTPTDVGRIREWTSGPNSSLYATVEPVPEGTRVTLTTSKASEAAQHRMVAALFGTMAAAFAFLGVFSEGGGDAGFWAFVSIFAALAVALPLLGRQSQKRWHQRRQGQFDALLDQFELLARDAAPPAAAPPVAAAPVQDRPAPDAEGGAGRLDLDDLPRPSEALDAPEQPASPSRRTRA
ncbi:hypothetical protein RQM47_05505 [Rubrivirga sp. S365]|uniref:DUF1707 domain-containing protein n=1 Tax=Rubrivirga litoralis TaxID=3075598 RepID=A0ABU3BR37_9BACT|nr:MULTISPECIES: hypothetical protein [unclassified Rubrivirga]MDT0631747.1 hypothetical protein [Rubrivirga sp. F394]MDT7856089.1 hypothetical protein [Rubrivirga sp. S365]